MTVQRFQKTYEALEAESVQEKKQLTDLHQQRVQSELNEKTRKALDDYMIAIDDNSDVSACSFQQCTLHNHNEQFFQVGLLDRALISLGLALSPPSTSVSSDFMVLCKCF